MALIVCLHCESEPCRAGVHLRILTSGVVFQRKQLELSLTYFDQRVAPFSLSPSHFEATIISLKLRVKSRGEKESIHVSHFKLLHDVYGVGNKIMDGLQIVFSLNVISR